jgi:hypothetical protein
MVAFIIAAGALLIAMIGCVLLDPTSAAMAKAKHERLMVVCGEEAPCRSRGRSKDFPPAAITHQLLSPARG